MKVSKKSEHCSLFFLYPLVCIKVKNRRTKNIIKDDIKQIEVVKRIG